jgi:3-hydroxyisobutyrate dehydrogenase-like beta-hydroxyacid dehydrogenase
MTTGNGTAHDRSVVGFVGLGRMGSAMAANLAAAGHRVIAYERRAEQRRPLTSSAFQVTGALEDLSECRIVVSMVPDDTAVTEVTFGAAGHDGLSKILQPGSLHLSMSTISPGCSRTLLAEHGRHGQIYVAAPVFGNPEAATTRELFIIAAGPPDGLARCEPVFDALGQDRFVVGTDPAAANLVKLAGNVMTAATLEIMGEVLALSRKSGVDAQQLLTILTSTMFGSRVHRLYGAKIVAQRYEPGGFVLPLALKDLKLALAEAEAAVVPMPMVNVVRDRMLTGIAKGYEHLDWSVLGRVAAEEAGLSYKRGIP